METVFTDITDYLLNQSWQIAILFAVVVIVCMAIRKKTAHLRYLLWLLIIAKCLVPSLITVSLAILPQKPLLQPLPESLPIREFAPPPETVIMSPGAPLSPPAPLPVRRPSIMAQLAQIPPKTWFSGIWLGGVGLFLLIVLIKAARFNHRLKGQRKRLTAGMQKEIDELLDRFGVHAKLHIWLLDGIGQPFVWGLLRGSIYLPANFGQIGSREHRRGILMHEITHVARFDAAVNCLQAIAQAVFWFHPLVWWANRNIRAEREKCCDETAIARLSAAPKVYSSAIVDTLIAEYQSTLPVPSLAIAGPIKNIEDRIKTIMKPGKKFYNRPTIIAIVTILLLAIAAVPTTIALTHRQAKKPEEYLTKTDVQVEGEDAVDVEVLTTVIKVEDEQGNPVAGAVITPDGLRTKKEKGSSHYFWRKDRYGEPVTVKTNAQGKAKVAYPRYANEKLETGSVSFLINHPDFCTDRPFYNIDETDKPVVLKRGAMLRVSGYLESKGDLLTGIYPQLGRGRLYSDSWQQSQEGVYETHQLPPGPHYIRLVYLPEDGPASFSEAVRFDAEKGETYEFNLQLKPGVRLEGTLDQSVPRPVRNGRVVAAAHPLNHPHHSKRPRKRFTDPSVDPGYLHWRSWREVEKDGTFVFESLPHGEVELIAICDGYISKNPPDEENMNIGIAQSWPLKEPVTGAKLKMKPTASCKIKVLDEHGKPVKGAQVGFSPNVQWHSGGAQIFATPLNTFDLLRAGGKLSPDKWLKISEVADFQAISDESGIAVVPNMPDGKRHFAVLHPQYQLPAKTGYAQFPRRVAEVELIAGQTAEVTVTMQKKGDDFLGAEDLDTRTSYKADIEIAKPFIQTCRPKYNPNAEDMQVLKGQKAGPSEISGIVTDQQGQPIEGVLVDVWTWYPGNETHTDKNGFFELKDFEPDQKTVEIRFSKAKYSPRYILRQPLGFKDTQVVLDDKTYFEGKVFDSDSKPVPNALIKAIAGPKDAEGVVLGEIPTVTTSGDDGSYRLYVQADTYDIQVKADKGVVRLPKVDIAKNEAKQLDFKLESSVTFKAKIVDSQTGKPVEGIRLFHWKHEDVDGTSNSDGLIEIIGMLPGKFEFWVEAEQCGRWWSQQCISKWNRRHIDDEETGWQRNFDGLDFDLSVGMEPVTIVTEKPVKINGKIVDPLGNPVAGATATLAKTGSGNSITGDTRYSFATDENGKFEMIVPASKEAEYNLLAHDGEYDEWRKWANGVLRPIKTIPGGIINDIVIELEKPASVKGKVLDSSGNPVPNNKVRSHAFDKLGNRYYDPTTRTGKNGDFEIKFIRAGKHYIQAYPFWLTAEQAPGKTSNIVTLQPGQNLEGIELITSQPEKLSPLKVKDIKNPDVQVEDVINIATANFGQIQDIEFVGKIKHFSENSEVISKEQLITTIWHAENKWEKQIVVTPGKRQDSTKYVAIHSWDGDNYKATVATVNASGETLHKEGNIISTRPNLGQDDALSAMAIKGGESDYLSFLKRPNVVIEGSTKIDGHDVLILKIDLQDTPKGKESYLYFKFYIDINRGALPVKIESYPNMKLATTSKCIEFTEIKEGLFLPTKVRIYLGEEHPNVKKRELVTDVKSIKLNQGLSKEDFGIEFEHNLPVWDQNVDRAYYHKVEVEGEPAPEASTELSERRTASAASDYKATLPNGVTVELVGICEYRGKSEQCWRPNGSSLDSALTIQEHKKFADEDRLGFIVKLSTDDFDLRFNIDGVNSYSGMEVFGTNGRELYNYWAAVARLDEERNTSNLRLGVATTDWQIIEESEKREKKDIVFSSPVESKHGTAISVRGDWDFDGKRRIVAIDNKGNSHIGDWSGHSSWSKTIVMSEIKDVKPEEIQKFQLQFRPYEWVEFKNVALRPNKKPEVQVEVGRARPNSSLGSKVNEPADKYNQILEPLNRQRQELEKELKALRDAYDDTEHLAGVRLTVSNAELETVGWLRKRYVASGVVRCEMPNQLLMQAETAIWPNSFEVHAARTAAYLKDRDFLQEVIRRDKVRRTKWFQARKKDMEKAIDSLADSLTVQVKDTADIEVKFTADNPGDAQTILDELLQLFILQQTDQAQNELTKKMAGLHEKKNRLKRSIQFMEDEKQTLQKEVQETQKPDVQVEILTDKPPVVLDLDSGKTLTLEKDWPNEYDVGWDNDGGGGLFCNRSGTTKMLPISNAEDFAGAVSIAFGLQESLDVHGIHGVLAEDSKYIAIKTSQENIAVLEIVEYSQSKAKVKWKIIEHVNQNPDVQVEAF